MPLYLTSSHSSLVRKKNPAAALRRTASSPYAKLGRTKATQHTKSTSLVAAEADDSDQVGYEKLDVTGKTLSCLTVASAKDVASAIDHATTTMFCQIPERAGMNSTRISQVLNFQKSLPPVVSLAHVYALLSTSSKTEREIASLLASGKIRKIRLAGRGGDMSGLSEVLVSSQILEAMLKSSGLSTDTIDEFLQVLHANPRVSSIPSRSLLPSALASLTKAGYLVSSSISGSAMTLSGSSLVATSTISRAASGTWAAVGGDATFENLGGVGSAKRTGSGPGLTDTGREMHLSLPNIGSYLRILYSGRAHLLELLGKFKYREVPLYLLREWWDGAVDSDNRISNAKRIRGEFSGIMPAKTKKWKDLSGLNFDWALEECLGAGLVELFETRSVGLGVRVLE